MRSLILLVLSVPWLGAQSPPARQLPADFQAYQKASRVKDARERIAAYEQFLREFPASAQSYAARRGIFEATFALHKDDRARLIATAKALLKAAPPEHEIRLANAIAYKLHSEEVYPQEALRLARRAVKAPGSRTQRATAEDTLGQIYRRAGKTKEAERWLKRALRNDPAAGEAALALAEMAEAGGRAAEALDYFTQARLAQPNRESMAKLEAAWKKQHGGSLAGLEAHLDERYRKLFPSPVHAPPYTKSAGRTARTVLAEVHTGAGCGPCLAADLAFDAVLERYSRRDVAVVMYHQHIPRPDPMANDASVALWKDRQGRGVPTFLLDGKPQVGGGGREEAIALEASLRAKIDQRLEAAPGAQLALAARRDGDSVRVRVQVEGAGGEAKLRLVLVEKLITYSGENGARFHPMVARSLHTAPAASQEYAFDLGKVAFEVRDHIDRFEKKDERHNAEGTFRFVERRDQMDRNNLAVVAYVENGQEVLQAAYADLQP